MKYIGSTRMQIGICILLIFLTIAASPWLFHTFYLIGFLRESSVVGQDPGDFLSRTGKYSIEYPSPLPGIYEVVIKSPKGDGFSEKILSGDFLVTIRSGFTVQTKDFDESIGGTYADVPDAPYHLSAIRLFTFRVWPAIPGKQKLTMLYSIRRPLSISSLSWANVTLELRRSTLL